MSSKRPASITIICIIGFIGLLITIPMVFSDAAKSLGDWYPPYLAFSALVGLACMIGLWMMKRWSVIIYTIFTAINQVALFIMGFWNIFAIIIPAIVVLIGILKYKEME